MVGWTMYRCRCGQGHRGHAEGLRVLGHGRRHFCPDCGTGLFFTNEKMLPGIIDVQSGTYDDPNAVPAQAHIQVAERIGWMERMHELPVFERFPPRLPPSSGRIERVRSFSSHTS